LLLLWRHQLAQPRPTSIWLVHAHRLVCYTLCAAECAAHKSQDGQPLGRRLNCRKELAARMLQPVLQALPAGSFVGGIARRLQQNNEQWWRERAGGWAGEHSTAQLNTEGIHAGCCRKATSRLLAAAGERRQRKQGWPLLQQGFLLPLH
jgi:hypothetical protein